MHGPRHAPAPAFQAKLPTPFAVLGIRTAGACLTGVAYLSSRTPAQQPTTRFAAKVCAQVERYIADPEFDFDLPYDLTGTPFQRKVWRAIAAIRSGTTLTYGELARRVTSAPRAVGAACGANPVPLIVPCHRVVARNGLGGFMNATSGAPMTIKQWLLRHEGI